MWNSCVGYLKLETAMALEFHLRRGKGVFPLRARGSFKERSNFHEFDFETTDLKSTEYTVLTHIG